MPRANRRTVCWFNKSTIYPASVPCSTPTSLRREKPRIPRPEELAKRAVESVGKADEGKDGISYLMNAIACGIETSLTPAYRAEILKLTDAKGQLLRTEKILIQE